MHTTKAKQEKRDRRHKRVRAKVHGTALRPRLAVFKSNKYMYGQLIDDDKGVTLVSISSLTDKKLDPQALGKKLAEAAATKKIKEVVFDRGGFMYIGRVKSFAEGAREGGLTF